MQIFPNKTKPAFNKFQRFLVLHKPILSSKASLLLVLYTLRQPTNTIAKRSSTELRDA